MSRFGEVRTALRRHSLAADSAVAILLAAFVLQEIFTSDVDGSPSLTVPCALGATLPLAWRRRIPLLTVAAVMGSLAVMSVLYDGTQEPQSTFVPVLLAVYSVAAHANRRTALAGLGVTIVALAIDEPGDMIVMVPVLTLAWAAGRLVQARERDAEKLRELAAALERERVEEARIAVAEERARIARDLHDVIAHAMSSIVLEAGAERVNLAAEQKSIRDTLASIERTGREAMVEMRRLVGVLRDDDESPALAPQPGLAQLGVLAEHVKRSGVSVELQVVGKPVELTPGLDISAYRIVQEALTNVMKHADAAHASVLVTFGARTLEVEVTDDGAGRNGTSNGGGHGLTGLRERVALFGGELHAGEREGGGFAVRARLPIEAARS